MNIRIDCNQQGVLTTVTGAMKNGLYRRCGGCGNIVTPSWLGAGAALSFTNNSLRIPIRATLCWNFRETENTTKISVLVGVRYKHGKIQNTKHRDRDLIYARRCHVITRACGSPQSDSGPRSILNYPRSVVLAQLRCFIL